MTRSPRESIATPGSVPPRAAADTTTGEPNDPPAGFMAANTLEPPGVPSDPAPPVSSQTTIASPPASIATAACSAWVPESDVDTVTGAENASAPALRLATRTAHGQPPAESPAVVQTTSMSPAASIATTGT